MHSRYVYLIHFERSDIKSKHIGTLKTDLAYILKAILLYCEAYFIDTQNCCFDIG